MKVRKIYRGVPFQGLYTSHQVTINVKPEQEKDSSGKKVKAKSVVIHTRKFVYPTDDHGLVKVLNVDQFSGKKFLLNACGWPMNDIQIFEEAQSDSIARAALSRLKTIGSREGDGLTLEQRFERIVPSSWSSPAEWIKACTAFGKLAYAQQQQQPEPQADPDPAPEPQVVNVNPE